MPTGLTITAGSPFATAASTSCSAAALLVEYGSVRAGGRSGRSATSPVASITAALLLVCTNRGTLAAVAAASTARVPSTLSRRVSVGQEPTAPARCSTPEQPAAA